MSSRHIDRALLQHAERHCCWRLVALPVIRGEDCCCQEAAACREATRTVRKSIADDRDDWKRFSNLIVWEVRLRFVSQLVRQIVVDPL